MGAAVSTGLLGCIFGPGQIWAGALDQALGLTSWRAESAACWAGEAGSVDWTRGRLLAGLRGMGHACTWAAASLDWT
ncbi:UNVERIFIED_CONTAM: hypothetical protein Sangu_2835700 [Sesamum angustifolium]|uniref:Uncharacterized protein n=1 Tax=Sesamum angustifolium TaxID=2727405 RepID=A0AAW2IRK2_9LAMI